MAEVKHLTMAELEAGLDEIRRSPRGEGILEMIVRRPQTEERESLEEGELDVTEGLVGDNWKSRGSSLTSDGSSHLDMQLNIMNSRAVAHVAQGRERWQLAGDQLFIDMDLSEVRGTLWSGGDEIRQFSCWQAAPSAWYQRQSHSARRDSGRRRGRESPLIGWRKLEAGELLAAGRLAEGIHRT